MKIKSLFSAIAFFAVSLNAAAVPNLVTNGDFSDGGNNWTLTGNTGYSSFPGYWNDGAVGSDAYLSQVVATIAGHTYEVSFDTGINWGTMAASLDGVTFITASGSGHYDAFVTAASDNATLTFITRNDPSYNQLDNVSMIDTTSAVPEPGSLALIGLGALGLRALRRKRSA